MVLQVNQTQLPSQLSHLPGLEQPQGSTADLCISPWSPSPSKHTHCIPWRQIPCGVAPAVVGGGATSSPLQVLRGVSGSFLHLRACFGSFLLLFQMLGHSYSCMRVLQPPVLGSWDGILL